MLKTLVVVAALTAGASSGAMAQHYYTCPAGYALIDGMCQPMATPGGVVSGAVGAAGAIAGGAVNAAGNIVGDTLGAVTGAPPPPPGYYR